VRNPTCGTAAPEIDLYEKHALQDEWRLDHAGSGRVGLVWELRHLSVQRRQLVGGRRCVRARSDRPDAGDAQVAVVASGRR